MRKGRGTLAVIRKRSVCGGKGHHRSAAPPPLPVDEREEEGTYGKMARLTACALYHKSEFCAYG